MFLEDECNPFTRFHLSTPSMNIPPTSYVTPGMDEISIAADDTKEHSENLVDLFFNSCRNSSSSVTILPAHTLPSHHAMSSNGLVKSSISEPFLDYGLDHDLPIPIAEPALADPIFLSAAHENTPALNNNPKCYLAGEAFESPVHATNSASSCTPTFPFLGKINQERATSTEEKTQTFILSQSSSLPSQGLFDADTQVRVANSNARLHESSIIANLECMSKRDCCSPRTSKVNVSVKTSLRSEVDKIAERRRRNRESSSRCYYNRKRIMTSLEAKLSNEKNRLLQLYDRSLELRTENARMRRFVARYGVSMQRTAEFCSTMGQRTGPSTCEEMTNAI